MVAAVAVKGLVERYAKVEALVKDSAVFPAAGLASYAVVRNGDGSQMYLVRQAAEHKHCAPASTSTGASRRPACPPCKHILAAPMAATQPAPKKAKIDNRTALAPINGDE